MLFIHSLTHTFRDISIRSDGERLAARVDRKIEWFFRSKMIHFSLCVSFVHICTQLQIVRYFRCVKKLSSQRICLYREKRTHMKSARVVCVAYSLLEWNTLCKRFYLSKCCANSENVRVYFWGGINACNIILKRINDYKGIKGAPTAQFKV